MVTMNSFVSFNMGLNSLVAIVVKLCSVQRKSHGLWRCYPPNFCHCFTSPHTFWQGANLDLRQNFFLCSSHRILYSHGCKSSLTHLLWQCLQREGCVKDIRCSQVADRTEVFTAQSLFKVSGLLPATKYEFTFITAQRSSSFAISTLESG